MKLPLYARAVYFLFMSVAHFAGLKIPGLFIYFNVPSNPYQDKIISLLVFGWALIFYTAGKTLSKDLIKTLLIIGMVAISVLTYINFTIDFKSFNDLTTPLLYHIEVITLSIYLTWLFISFKREFKNVG